MLCLLAPPFAIATPVSRRPPQSNPKRPRRDVCEAENLGTASAFLSLGGLRERMRGKAGPEELAMYGDEGAWQCFTNRTMIAVLVVSWVNSSKQLNAPLPTLFPRPRSPP